MFWISVIGCKSEYVGKYAAWWRSAPALSPGDSLHVTAAVLNPEVSIRSGNVDRKRLCEVAA